MMNVVVNVMVTVGLVGGWAFALIAAFCLGCNNGGTTNAWDVEVEKAKSEKEGPSIGEVVRAIAQQEVARLLVEQRKTNELLERGHRANHDRHVAWVDANRENDKRWKEGVETARLRHAEWRACSGRVTTYTIPGTTTYTIPPPTPEPELDVKPRDDASPDRPRSVLKRSTLKAPGTPDLESDEPRIELERPDDDSGGLFQIESDSSSTWVPITKAWKAVDPSEVLAPKSLQYAKGKQLHRWRAHLVWTQPVVNERRSLVSWTQTIHVRAKEGSTDMIELSRSSYDSSGHTWRRWMRVDTDAIDPNGAKVQVIGVTLVLLHDEQIAAMKLPPPRNP